MIHSWNNNNIIMQPGIFRYPEFQYFRIVLFFFQFKLESMILVLNLFLIL